MRSAAVFGLKHQPLLASLFLSLTEAGSADEVISHGGFLPVADVPGQDFGAPDVHHQVEEHPEFAKPLQSSVHVPPPHLMRTCSSHACSRSGPLVWLGPTVAVGFLMVVHYPNVVPLKAVIKLSTDQGGYDLARRRPGRFDHVAGELAVMVSPIVE